MDERDDVLKDTFTRAVPPLPAALEARTVAAMRAATPARSGGRTRWLPITVGVVAILLTLGLDPFTPLRRPPVPEGPTVGEASAAEEALPVPSESEEQSPAEKAVAPYRQRAAEFVRAHYPKDADMLMAAGLLTTDRPAALEFLKQAVSLKSSSAAWAAYVIALAKDGPEYHRPGGSGIDPADAQQVAEEARMSPEMHLPDRLSEREAAPVLAATREWERADPQNALPLVYETWYLYGLHRDAEALACWRRAAALPRFDLDYWRQTGAVARLLSRLGMKAGDATSYSYIGSNAYEAFARVRSCARLAEYEGRLAQLQGRATDALAWWNATMGLASHMQDSADIVIQVLVANAVEGIGGRYVWLWTWDLVSGVPGGPLLGGRYYQGPAYDFYLRHAGRKAADDIRDRLVRGKLRSELVREAQKRRSVLPGWMWLVGSAAAAGAFAVLFLTIFAAVGTWRRRQADEATQLGWGLRSLIAALAILPALAGAAAASWSSGFDVSVQWLDPLIALPAALLLALFLALVLPLLAVWTSRRPGARVATAWRGNLRQVLPLAVALCGGLALCFGLTAKAMQVSWTNRFYAGKNDEMVRLLRQIGPEWDHPHVPLDAWRAEPPPKAQ